MSNPYDPDPYGGKEGGQPGGQPGPYGGQPGAPYGSQPGPPYGSQPGGQYGGQYGGGYGAPYGQPGGYGAPARKTDPVSITGLVLSFSCCLSLVGAVLGFIGLSRTSGGQRAGRWAAVTASIVGVLGTIAFGLGIWGVVFLAGQVVTVENADVGTCIDVEQTGREIEMTEQDCSDTHDAEIVVAAPVSDFGGDFAAAADEEICRSLLPQDDAAALDAYAAESGRPLQYSVIVEDLGPQTDSSDFVCYVESPGGTLDRRLTS